MPKAKYQFEDFLAIIPDDCKAHVVTIHELMLQNSYKPKIQVTKSTGLQLSYAQPKIKSVIGIILILFIRDEKLKIRVYGNNYKAYPDVLNGLPENISSQIDNADNCVKFIDPQKCWKGCIGYDFHIREKHFQKCITNCFQLDVDSESMPYLLEMIQNEYQCRQANL